MDKKNVWDKYIIADTVLIKFGLWLANRHGSPEKFKKGDKSP